MLLVTPAASILSRKPSAVIVRPSTSTPMWAWASVTSTPAGIFPRTHAHTSAIAPLVRAWMLCLRSVSVVKGWQIQCPREQRSWNGSRAQPALPRLVGSEPRRSSAAEEGKQHTGRHCRQTRLRAQRANQGAQRRWPRSGARRKPLALGLRLSAQGEHRDAGAVHALDVEGGTFGLDGVAELRGASQRPEDVAADGVEVLVRQVEVEILVHLDDGDAAVDGVDAVPDLLNRRLPLVELVLDLPDELLEDVLYRYESFDAAPLVYDDRHLQLALLELLQDLLYGLVLRDDEALPDEGPDVEIIRVLARRAQEVLHVDRAEDVVEVVLIDRVTRVAPEDRRIHHLRERGVHPEGLDVRPGDHDLASHPVSEVEDVVEVLSFSWLQLTRGGGAGDHDPQHLLGVGLHLLPEPYTPGPQDKVGRGVDDPHQRPEEDHADPERAADPERGPLGPLDREVLRRLLSEDQVRVGDYREPKHEGDDAHGPLARYPDRPEGRLD